MKTLNDFSKLHIYEPVPDFYEKLERVWSDHVKTNPWDVTVHKYGLGDTTRTILLSEADLKDGDADLAARAEAKESVAPPEDALEKDSVAVFFALLGAFPIAIMIAGLAGGARPFGL